MATAISPIKRQVSKPYLTLAEYKAAPTALDYGNLVQGGNQSQQDAELTNAITRASSWIDQYCNQILSATIDVEQQRVRLRPDGSLRFHPKYSPIVALLSLSAGYNPQAMTAVPDPSVAWLEESQVVFPFNNANLTWSSQGPISFGAAGSPRQEMFIQYSYINGFANTTVGSAASAGNTTLTVADPTGLTAGESVQIYDGANTENITIDSTYVFGSATVPLTSPLLYSHAVGVSVSSLPAAVKQAAILVTSAYLKIRGDGSLVMAVTNQPNTSVTGSQMVGSDIGHAQELLAPFKRIR
jgi:hypothetical protein